MLGVLGSGLELGKDKGEVWVSVWVSRCPHLRLRSRRGGRCSTACFKVGAGCVLRAEAGGAGVGAEGRGWRCWVCA